MLFIDQEHLLRMEREKCFEIFISTDMVLWLKLVQWDQIRFDQTAPVEEPVEKDTRDCIHADFIAGEKQQPVHVIV